MNEANVEKSLTTPCNLHIAVVIYISGEMNWMSSGMKTLRLHMKSKMKIINTSLKA